MLFTADVPYVQVQQAPVIMTMVAEAGNGKSKVIVDKCREVGNDEAYANSAYNAFEVGYTVLTTLGYTLDTSQNGYGLAELVRTSVKLYVITPPANGEVFQTTSDKENMLYSYRANKDYVGSDSFVIGVNALTRNGKPVHYKLKYNLSVVEQITNELEPSTCADMKFSSLPNTLAIMISGPIAHAN